MPANPNKYYTVKEVADIMCVSAQRVQQKIQDGRFPNHTRCPCCVKGKISIPIRDVHGEFHRMLTQSYAVKQRYIYQRDS